MPLRSSDVNEGRNKLRPTEVLAIAPSLSVDEASLLTGIGRTMLYQQIKLGGLKLRKCGGSSVILRHELNAWMASLPVKET